MQNPSIIQGGMGAGVSGWPLARSVARAGQLGVVAGTALDLILARRLQAGDAGGHMRRALERFPVPDVAARIVERYYIPGGKDPSAPFKPLPLLTEKAPRSRHELIVAANFVEVFLAKEGHDGCVGINYLEKIQLPTLPSLLGAMLAGVDYVLMGAGIPRAIPGVLDAFAEGRGASLPIDVRREAGDASATLELDPANILPGATLQLKRPRFLAIVASASLAKALVRKSTGKIDGLVLEGPTAGGHNAPPRGTMRFDAAGEPIFGKRDQPDFEAIAALGLPFWLAGSWAFPGAVAAAQSHGASGIQVGTAFAFSRQSGVDNGLKARALEHVRAGDAHVATDALASPTGFPFKVFQLEGTLSDPEAFEQREKICDLGYLRQAYARPDGRVGWRCSGEPDDKFLHKGGSAEDIQGRKCVCNGLMANIGLGQVQRSGKPELALLTSGSDLHVVEDLIAAKGSDYGAEDVLDYLLSSPCVVD